MEFEVMTPGPQLMESMRAVGYSLETAIADVIDNSITAEATRIQIRFSAEPEDTFLSISDDGYGMDAQGVRHAMRLAARNPGATRTADDLGRFGLGLKTASLSQCRVLTLISKKDGTLVGVQWDLDHLAATGQWQLRVLSDAELQASPHASHLEEESSGTVVLWQNIDLTDPNHEQFVRDFTARMVSAREHLALVYHRFLSGEDGRRVGISINLEPVKPVDPFLRHNRATQRGQRETIRVAGQEITLQPYTLPYMTKMSGTDRDQIQSSGLLRDNQGFYIYRAGRLVIWGTWFRLVPRGELGKLARVQVDLPNTLDHLWALDIKKSAASPPPAVRQALRQVVNRILQPSERAFRHKGVADDDPTGTTRTWTGSSSRDGFYYEINREHPVLVNLVEQLDTAQFGALEIALRTIESSFPVSDAYLKLTGDQAHRRPDTTDVALRELAAGYWHQWSARGGSAADFINALAVAEQFSSSKDVRALLTEATETGDHNDDTS